MGCEDGMQDPRSVSCSSNPSEFDVFTCFLNSGKFSVTIFSKWHSFHLFSFFFWDSFCIDVDNILHNALFPFIDSIFLALSNSFGISSAP